MTTMKDVAARAGVSVATVSHVINGTRTVTEPTRNRVLAAIDALQYVNDPIARALRTGTTTTIGLVMDAVQNPYFSDVVAALERATVAAGYTLLIADHHDDPVMELRAVNDLMGRRVSGLLLQPTAAPDETLSLLKAKELPCVMVDRSTHAGLDFVGTENREAMAALTTHLIDHGHSRIGLIYGAEGSSTTEERIAGYRDAHRHRQLPVLPELLVGGHSTEEGATRATEHLLDLTTPPTALITANNRMTIGSMRTLTERRLIPPHSIALGCFDDFPWADSFTPRLTCSRQDAARIGNGAVHLLLRRITDPQRAREATHVPATLILRDSCGCPPTGPV